MCARFASATPWRELAESFGFDPEAVEAVEPRWNIAPGTEVLALKEGDAGPVAFRPTWGFRNPVDGQRLANARIEGAGDKPTFRDSLKNRRCVLPADGFFEWTDGPDGKQPHFLSPADGGPVAFAALWELVDGEARVVVLTRESDDVASRVHPRMPVILSAEASRHWISGEAGSIDAVRVALAEETALVVMPVDRRMNDPRVDGPHVLAPPRQLRLL